MWTPTLKVKEKVNDTLHIVVEFANGARLVSSEWFLSNTQSIKKLVTTKIAQLDALDTLEASLVKDALVDTTPDVIVPPTQAALDAQAWLADYRKWVTIKTSLIDTGILTGNETPVTNLKTKVQTNFKAAYLDLL